ncbi:flavin reductase family protein [Nocardioides sambongensis]|uniref:flavin reductase family protein n=1 Tax=Nocardioides sambongensis TaxID=2589074 RepID=UPI0018C895A6|nr:flavin reductase family protein [Nocardioides sambongensis]
MSVRTVFDPADAGVNAYRLLTALVVPRPIAWVTSLSADGVLNLAPHSFFTVASARPPIVQFTSVGHKDTLRNVTATGEFVVNFASEAQTELINASSAPYPPEVGEADVLGIETVLSERVAPPRVAASPASIECRLHSTVPLGESTLVLGDVVAIGVDSEVLDGDHPRFDLLRPMSRLGRDEWGLPPATTRLTRPTRAD